LSVKRRIWWSDVTRLKLIGYLDNQGDGDVSEEDDDQTNNRIYDGLTTRIYLLWITG
jgi:hypothetical protein